MEGGYHLSIEGVRKGCLSCHKWYSNGHKWYRLTRSGATPRGLWTKSCGVTTQIKPFLFFLIGNILRNKNLKFCWILTMFTFEIENDNKTTELTAWKLGEGDRSRRS